MRRDHPRSEIRGRERQAQAPGGNAALKHLGDESPSLESFIVMERTASVALDGHSVFGEENDHKEAKGARPGVSARFNCLSIGTSCT